jgi:hypothetical protein
MENVQKVCHSTMFIYRTGRTSHFHFPCFQEVPNMFISSLYEGILYVHNLPSSGKDFPPV